MKSADKGGFSAAGTPDKDYLAGFDLFGKAKAAVIFLSVFRVNKSGVDGIFFGHKNTSESVVYKCILAFYKIFFNRFRQKGFTKEKICVIMNKESFRS